MTTAAKANRKALAASTTHKMKSISASIIVVAGTILILGGSYIQHGDTKLFVQIVGCLVGAIGLWGWFVSLKEK